MKNAIFLTLLLAISNLAIADSKIKDFKASSTVNRSCLLSVTDVNFGNYDSTDIVDKSAENTVTFRCTKGTAWDYYSYAAYYASNGVNNGGITMSQAEKDTIKNSIGSTGYASAMKNGTSRLYYQVKLSDGIWDNDVDMPGRVNMGHYVGTSTGEVTSFNLSYRIIKSQYVAPGLYRDTQTAYIAF